MQRRFGAGENVAAIDLALLAALTFLASLSGTRLLLGALRRRRMMDVPNERSSHAVPTPRGAGMAVLPVTLAALAWLGGEKLLPYGWEMVLPVAAGLTLLSWLDDRSGLPAAVRLAAHLVAATIGLWMLPPDSLVFQGLLPLWPDRLAALIAWAWFINLYNFMDGIDGITGIETASLGLGLGLVALAVGIPLFLPAGIALAAAVAGFLVWNWHPARVFLGDSGSIPLGYLLGWLLLVAAAQGLWLPALVLPLYYLADATVTLAMRAWRREKLSQAHRQHFYQRAAARRGHPLVALAVLGCNLVLFGAAWIGAGQDALAGFALAAIAAIGFLALLGRWSRPPLTEIAEDQ